MVMIGLGKGVIGVEGWIFGMMIWFLRIWLR